ncbi:MAG: ribonuclease E/G, partial [Gaiellaceae bacterium]
YVGSRSKKSGGRLEDTITKNNLEAVKEVVRQLRLRDIGGIIVIDFIDMASPKNRAAVESALGEELERDRTKTYVVEISPLGLVEMTRQNVTDGPREVMTKKCPTCGGDGIVVSELTAAVDIERRLRALVTPGSREKAFKVEVSARVASLVVGPGGSRLRELEETTRRRFFLVGKEGEHLDHFRVLQRGTLEKVAPPMPFDVGAEVEVKLGEVGLHDPRAGVGKIDNVDVIVGNAAKLVGKRVKARITAVTEGAAWAELLVPAAEIDEPLTAEAEAEKPTRVKRPVPSRKKPGDALEAASDLEEEEGAEPADAVADARPAEEGEDREEGEDGEPAAPAKKKTRRGTRGGRNRKKKTATAVTNGSEPAAAEEGEEGEEQPEAGTPAEQPQPEAGAPGEQPEPDEEPGPENEARPDGPVIHVPDRELGAAPAAEDGDGDGSESAPAKKKTRRGSRGGKNRKKKTAAAGAVVAVAEEAAPEEAPEREPVAEDEEPQNGEPDWGYTPMSQWGLDE